MTPARKMTDLQIDLWKKKKADLRWVMLFTTLREGPKILKYMVLSIFPTS